MSPNKDSKIPDYTLKEIRDAINKAWVLGDDRFKKQIEKQAGRRVSPMVRGGDRKSEKYRPISYSDPFDCTNSDKNSSQIANMY